jgi:SAM-dependent methyltransferase
LWFARRLVEEQGLQNVQLLCASANALPFADGSVDFITGLDLIEHLDDPAASVKELIRVAAANGRLYFNSQNRYNVFTPEDHCRLWWIGFLPRRYVNRFVRCFGRSYEGTRPLSIVELRTLFRGLPVDAHIHGLIFSRRAAGDSIGKTILSRSGVLLSILNSVFRRVIPSYNILLLK